MAATFTSETCFPRAVSNISILVGAGGMFICVVDRGVLVRLTALSSCGVSLGHRGE